MPTVNMLRTVWAINGIAGVQRVVGDSYLVAPAKGLLGFTLIPLVP